MTEIDATPAPPYVTEDFERFYARLYRPVVKVAVALSGSRWAAEELAQEAFVRVYRRWDQVAHLENPDAYVKRIAVNLALSRRRRLGAEARALAKVAAGVRPAVAHLDALDGEFWSAVRGLPPRQAQVLALTVADGMTPAEIAFVLECDPATARVHLHRARKAVAARLGLVDSPLSDGEGDS